MTPTPEQAAIVSAATADRTNLLVSALAGAAKTSTLVLLAKALPAENMLCLAFNKKIATEMQERLPPNCTAMTLSSLGYRSWRALVGKLTVKEGKTYFAIRDYADEHFHGEDRDVFWESYEDIRFAINLAKSNGFVPSGATSKLRSLLDEPDFFDALPFVPNEDELACIMHVLRQSIVDGFRGIVDYDDMLYLPTLCSSATFPIFSTILVDEVQDLSILNHAMLKKLARSKTRIIAVGDQNQSIYGFRGADSNSIRTMISTFDMKEYNLTISFRCPRTVVREAHWRAPNMRFPEWAIEGTVRTLGAWSASDIVPHSVILCRNNAPLFTCAVNLLRAGLYPEIVGNDLTKRFEKILAKLGSPTMTEAEALAAVELWAEGARKKQRDLSKVEDLRECLLIFVRGSGTLGGAIAKMQRILASAGPIKLMTGHKSKGLEFPDVYILDQHLVRSSRTRGGEKWNEQEANLLYVMQTRAKSSLTYITTDGFISPDDDEAPVAHDADGHNGLGE